MGRPFNIHPITDDSALGGSAMARSLIFNDSDNTRLTRTIGSTSNRRTFTYSWWLKRTMKSSEQYVWYVGSSSGTPYLDARFEANSHELQIQDYTPNRPIRFITNRKFRDVSSWYHFVFAVDTTQGTASNRAKLYVNGVQETSFSTETYPDQNYDSSASVSGHIQVWGTNKASTSNDLDGYLAEAHFVDGQQLTPSSFGYTDDVTGIWRPKKYEGTYGTNGFYLDFSDNSAATATTLGKDRSGNDNNFTPSNFSVAAGAANHSLLDTPTNNFCTMNPLVITPNATHANGNLDLSGSASDSYSQSNLSTFGVSSGKWYAEVKITYSTTNVYVGVCPITTPGNTNLTGTVTDAAVIRMSNESYIEGTETANVFGSGISSGNIIGIALDMDNQKVWVSVQGTYANSGNPETGTNAFFSGITAGETMAICARPLNGTLNFNFGQRPFTYTPPTGYKAWSTNNLLNHSLPSVINPKKHFETLTYTGNGATNNITSLEFQPDFVWIKAREDAHHHTLHDSVRGPNKQLYSNLNNGEHTHTVFLTAFLYNGFTLGDNSSGTGATNVNGRPYVAWCWKAGGAAVSNTNGNITSSVSVNEEAGFSIVSYTGNGSNGQTVGHGLTQAPQWIILKARDATQNWRVWHHKLAADGSKRLILDSNNAMADASFLNDTAPTSTVFTLGNADDAFNANGAKFIVYCWYEIPGYSKFGSYKGNGNSDGTFVYTGFKPGFIMFKNANTATNWEMYDTTRPYAEYNPALRPLYANHNYVEETHGSYPALDILSTGFKIRSNWEEFNKNGDTITYAAFAEKPSNTPFGTEPSAR